MKILLNDVMQHSANAPKQLISPALADTYTFAESELKVNFPAVAFINSIGIGNCPAEEMKIYRARGVIDGKNAGSPAVMLNGNATGNLAIDGNDAGDELIVTIANNEDGLYLLGRGFSVLSVKIAVPKGTAIGRLAMGRAVSIPTSVAKEPGYFSTSEPRRTLSGQVVPGVGGYNYRVVSLDSRYKLSREAFEEIEAGRKSIGAGYPFFIDLTAESYKLPFNKLYATEKNQRSMSFEGGIKRFLYSRRWNFEEAF